MNISDVLQRLDTLEEMQREITGRSGNWCYGDNRREQREVSAEIAATTFTPAYSPPTADVFWQSSPAERRIMLAELLEHEDKLPLRWDFEHVESGCGTAGCALGSATRLWAVGASIMPHVFCGNFSKYADVELIFGFEAARLYGLPFRAVTPQMVAAKLRSYVD